MPSGMAYLILPISVRTFLDLLVSVGYRSVSSFPEKNLGIAWSGWNAPDPGQNSRFCGFVDFCYGFPVFGEKCFRYICVSVSVRKCRYLCICICICWYSLNGRQTSSDTPVSVSAPTNPPISSAMIKATRRRLRRCPKGACASRVPPWV